MVPEPTSEVAEAGAGDVASVRGRPPAPAVVFGAAPAGQFGGLAGRDEDTAGSAERPAATAATARDGCPLVEVAADATAAASAGRRRRRSTAAEFADVAIGDGGDDGASRLGLDEQGEHAAGGVGAASVPHRRTAVDVPLRRRAAARVEHAGAHGGLLAATGRRRFAREDRQRLRLGRRPLALGLGRPRSDEYRHRDDRRHRRRSLLHFRLDSTGDQAGMTRR